MMMSTITVGIINMDSIYLIAGFVGFTYLLVRHHFKTVIEDAIDLNPVVTTPPIRIVPLYPPDPMELDSDSEDERLQIIDDYLKKR